MKNNPILIIFLAAFGVSSRAVQLKRRFKMPFFRKRVSQEEQLWNTIQQGDAELERAKMAFYRLGDMIGTSHPGVKQAISSVEKALNALHQNAKERNFTRWKDSEIFLRYKEALENLRKVLTF